MLCVGTVPCHHTFANCSSWSCHPLLLFPAKLDGRHGWWSGSVPAPYCRTNDYAVEQALGKMLVEFGQCFLTHQKWLTLRVNHNSFSSQCINMVNAGIAIIVPWVDCLMSGAGNHIILETWDDQQWLQIFWMRKHGAVWQACINPPVPDHLIQGNYTGSETGCYCPVEAGYIRQLKVCCKPV